MAEKGPIAGYPVIDFKATLYDGSFHTVDSDEMSFRLAGPLATRKGIQEAQPVLLEPIMDVEVRVPEVYMGDVNRDLNTRRGRVLGMDSDDGMQVVRAHVPQAELFTYATELRSLTGGRGHVPRDPRPLRGGAGPRGPEDHRGAQEGAGAPPATDRGRRRSAAELSSGGRLDPSPSSSITPASGRAPPRGRCGLRTGRAQGWPRRSQPRPVPGYRRGR